MPIFNLFSKRQRIARGEIPDVYVYDKIDQKFRVQVVHITRDALGEDKYGRRSADAYDFIHDSLCREYGEFELTKHSRNKEESLIEFFLLT